jgi:hypothetical protein
MFLAIQHPGEDTGSTFENPSTRWPDFRRGHAAAALGGGHHEGEVDGVPYLRCDGCGSILAEQAFLDRTIAGEARQYDDELLARPSSQRPEQRGHGASLIRLAEVFLYARRPIRRFLDVSCGAGTLLDAAAELLPEIADTFWGIEPFPPPPEFRARHRELPDGLPLRPRWAASTAAPASR